MGSISIKCGTSRRYPGILPWSPSPIAYCVQPNTMSASFTSCNAMSRPRWMVRQEVGVVTPRRKRFGLWQPLLPPGCPKARRCKMSWNPSLPCLPIEGQSLCCPRSWMRLAWSTPSRGWGDVLLLPDTNQLILLVFRHCKSRVTSTSTEIHTRSSKHEPCLLSLNV
jgi:hypothetical protein